MSRGRDRNLRRRAEYLVDLAEEKKRVRAEREAPLGCAFLVLAIVGGLAVFWHLVAVEMDGPHVVHHHRRAPTADAKRSR